MTEKQSRRTAESITNSVRRREFLAAAGATVGAGAITGAGVSLGSREVAAAQTYGISHMTDSGSEAALYLHGPQAEYSSSAGKTYLVFRGPSADPYAMSYDHSSQSFSGPVQIGTNPLSDTDEHGPPALTIDDDGILHVFYGCHTTTVQYARSDSPNDISSWSNFDLTSVDEGTYTSPLTYNNDVYCLYRGGNHEHGTLIKSTDGGDTWSDTTIADFSTGGYNHDDFYIGDFDVFGSTLHFSWAIAEGDSHDDNRQDVYHAYYDPSDGNVYAYDGTNLGSTIEWADIDACRLTAQNKIWSVHHAYDGTNIYILHQNDADGDGSWQWRLTTYDTSADAVSTQNVAGLESTTPANYGRPRINDSGNLEAHIITGPGEGGDYHVATLENGSWNDSVVVSGSGSREQARVETVRNGNDDFAAVIAEGETSDSKQTIWAVGTEFPQPSTVSVTKDNADSSGITVTGNWPTSTWADNYVGSNYLHDDDSGKGSKSVEFTPDLPDAGTYDVYLYWNQSSSRASSVPIDIDYDGGTDTVDVNMTTNGGQWNLLGSYSMASGTGNSVTIRNDGTSGYVIADAVMFEK